MITDVYSEQTDAITTTVLIIIHVRQLMLVVPLY